MADFTKLNGYTVKDPNAIHTYDTVADLKADTKLKAGNHVATKGYTTAGDGGHATYIIVNDNTLVDDGGSVHDLTNGLKAVMLINQYVTPQMFGAYGDGVHDDTIALQNAIDSYDYIEIPSGVYLVSQVTINEKDKKIKGNNALLKSIDNNTSTSIINVTNDGCNGLELKDIEIDGNKDNVSSELHGIYFTRAVYADCFSTVENIEVHNMTGDGIKITALNHALIREMKFIKIHSYLNDGDGFYADTLTDSFISTSVFNNNNKNGIYIDGGGSIKINHVKCYWNGYENADDLDVNRLPDGVMVITSDASPVSGKKYYTRTGYGNWQSSYKYNLFTGSTFDGSTDYYEVSNNNYVNKYSGIVYNNGSVLLISNSEMQCNAGDGIHCENSYNIIIENTSLDNNGYIFNSNNQAQSYATAGLTPFFAGFYAYNTEYINVIACCLNAFYNTTGISQAFGVMVDKCKKVHINIQSRLLTAPVKLRDDNPEDIYVLSNGNLLPIDMDVAYNISDIPENYALYSSGNDTSKMQLIGNKVYYKIFIVNNDGFATTDLNILTFNDHLRPEYNTAVQNAFMSSYYPMFNNGSLTLAYINSATGKLAMHQNGSNMKYANFQGYINLVIR